jgi:hypothetical protein
VLSRPSSRTRPEKTAIDFAARPYDMLRASKATAWPKFPDIFVSSHAQLRH